MKKTYRMFLALVLTALCAMNVNAETKEISLEEIPFWAFENVWGPDAPKNTQVEKVTEGDGCLWVVGTPAGNVYGDVNVKAFADLSAYTKLVVTVSEGSPRFLFNRDVDEGQWADDEAASHLIDNTKGGWSAKYFSQSGNVLTVDLKQLVKDKGYAPLHSIKGANWANVTITSMELERQGKAQVVGWTNIINNSDMEGDDVSSFFSKTAQSAPYPSTITDGVGVNGSRGIVVEATAKEANAWDNQFWFRFNEPLEAGQKYHVSFNYRADQNATVSTQAHAEPSDYIHYELFGNLNFTSAWQTYDQELEVTASQSTDAKKFLSAAFNLNELSDANNYYFDNIVVEIYKEKSPMAQIKAGFDSVSPMSDPASSLQ